MKAWRSKPIRHGLAVVLVAWMAGLAFGQGNYPSKPIKIIAPVQPGGGVDLVARTIADRLGRALGQSIIVENQSGGGGVVGSMATARAAPDGYTLMVGYVGTHGTNPAVRKLPYDAVKDFTPIAMVGGTPNILVVPPSLPVETLQEFIAYAKANPGQAVLRLVGAGHAHPPRDGAVQGRRPTSTSLHVPYRGIGPAITDILGGQTQAMFPGLAAALPHIKAGKMRPLAVTGTSRHPLLPGRADVRGAGLQGLRRRAVVRHRRPGEHAAGDRQAG